MMVAEDREHFEDSFTVKVGSRGWSLKQKSDKETYSQMLLTSVS